MDAELREKEEGEWKVRQRETWERRKEGAAEMEGTRAEGQERSLGKEKAARGA